MRARFAHAADDDEALIGPTLAWLGETLDRFGISGPRRHELYLALDELVANVAHYAYEAGATRHIALDLERRPETLRVTITDRGRAFNPLTNVRPPRDVPIEELEIGGLGIFLVTQMVDEARYRRRDGKNVLTLVKRL
jgi:anti-sigma regulatory factor (Ser/Thr protein kinase)